MRASTKATVDILICVKDANPLVSRLLGTSALVTRAPSLVVAPAVLEVAAGVVRSPAVRRQGRQLRTERRKFGAQYVQLSSRVLVQWRVRRWCRHDYARGFVVHVRIADDAEFTTVAWWRTTPDSRSARSDT